MIIKSNTLFIPHFNRDSLSRKGGKHDYKRFFYTELLDKTKTQLTQLTQST
jgi:hypothetical protein